MWYRGEPTMCTLSSWGWTPKRKSSPDSPSAASSGVIPASLRKIPLGLPVVPDV